MKEKLVREVRFWPAFDKRKEGDGRLGQHCVDMRCYVKGKKGVIQFYLMTGWMAGSVSEPEDVSRSLSNFHSIFDGVKMNPLPADLGYHSYKPMYEGHDPMACELLEGGKCYYNGSSLTAAMPWSLLVHRGDEVMWQYLEDYYFDLFGEEEEIVLSPEEQVIR